MQHHEIFDKQYSAGKATEVPKKLTILDTTETSVDTVVQIYGTGKVKRMEIRYRLKNDQDQSDS